MGWVWRAGDPGTMQNSDLAVNNVERIGMLLYTDYLVPFEVASMLLLVAMVGAIILAKRELCCSPFFFCRT